MPKYATFFTRYTRKIAFSREAQEAPIFRQEAKEAQEAPKTAYGFIFYYYLQFWKI